MTIEQQIAKGFVEKCAQYGVDPELMAKEAGLLDGLLRGGEDLTASINSLVTDPIDGRDPLTLARFHPAMAPLYVNKRMLELQRLRRKPYKPGDPVHGLKDVPKKVKKPYKPGDPVHGLNYDKEASAAFAQGFVEKCAQYGVDPELMAKEAVWFEGLNNIGKGLAQWGGDKLNVGGWMDYMSGLAESGDHYQAAAHRRAMRNSPPAVNPALDPNSNIDPIAAAASAKFRARNNPVKPQPQQIYNWNRPTYTDYLGFVNK